MGTSDLEITIDCTELTSPRWDLVSKQFHDSFPHKDLAIIAPVFHVDETTGPFSMRVRLEGAELDESVEAPWFDRATSEGYVSPKKDPLQYRVGAGGALEVQWKGFGYEMPRIGRWVLRFFAIKDEERQPIHIVFMFAVMDEKQMLLRNLSVSPALASKSGATYEVAKDEGARSLEIGLRFEAGAPYFCDKDGQDVFICSNLPPGVHLEPLIVVKKHGVAMDIDFTCAERSFSPAVPDECNMAYGGGSSLALHWFGVTNGKLEPKCDPMVATGFAASWCGPYADDTTKSHARVHWKEPEENKIGIASFFFRDLLEVQTKAMIGGDEGVLVDPTIIYDPPPPPPPTG